MNKPIDHRGKVIRIAFIIIGGVIFAIGGVTYMYVSTGNLIDGALMMSLGIFLFFLGYLMPTNYIDVD